jgi:hypothetical protein
VFKSQLSGRDSVVLIVALDIIASFVLRDTDGMDNQVPKLITDRGIEKICRIICSKLGILRYSNLVSAIAMT